MKSRERFIGRVAEKIDENHGIHSESFIFGISGKWGEGKTMFLKGLETELRKKKFIVVWISAWKYGTDKTALLRNFLLELRKALKVIEGDEFDTLSHDISENRIAWKKLLPFVSLLIGAGLIYHLLKVNNVFQLNELLVFFGTAILLPIGLAAAKAVTTVQRSSRSIATMDKFDDLLKFILAHRWSRKKVVVFVDDLDRVSPTIARDVLDNLRTFFDEPTLSYVVTADHTVLEKHIGSAILSDGKASEQLHEGRRFLKKIFNYYWRLPLPIDLEFRSFLDSEFTKIFEKLNLVLASEEDRQIFKGYLLKFFGKNPREVLRFIDTVLFTFEIIKIQEDESDDQNKVYYQSMLKNPLLVVRVLMIQELCPAFFEEIIQDNTIFGDIELSVAKGESKKLEDLLDKYESKISTAQKNLLIRFLHERPRFRGSTAPYSLLVPDYRPFINLAADASFGDSRGPEPEAFVTLLKAGSAKDIQETLDATGKQQLEKAATATVEVFANDSIEAKEKVLHLTNLLKALNAVKNSVACNPPFFAKLKEVDFAYLQDSSIDRNARDAAIIEMLKWLDGQTDEQEFQEYFDVFSFLGEGEIELITSKINNTGRFTSHIIMDDWFKKMFEKNKASALKKLDNLEIELEADVVSEYLSEDEMHKAILGVFAASSDAEVRNAIFDIEKKYNPAKLKDLVSTGLSLIRELDEKFWEWLQTREDNEWKKEKVEQQIIDALNDVDQEQAGTLDAVLQYASGRIQASLSTFWKRILEKYSSLLLGTLLMSIGYPTLYEAIAPSTEEAKKLFKQLADDICSVSDPNSLKDKLLLLQKQHWLWRHLSSPDGNKIKKIRSLIRNFENNELIKQAVEGVLKSWGITDTDQQLPTS